MDSPLLDGPEVGRALAQVEAEMARLVRAPTPGVAGPDLLGPIAQEHLDGGGKRLRARLALAAAHLQQVSPAAAVAWAAACELAHNATLVHDDLQDGDHVRRGRPTTWARHGAAQAINAGDLMLMLPFLAVAGPAVPAPARAPLSAALATGLAAVIRGQAAEAFLSAGHQEAAVAYRAAVSGKTAALFALPVAGAALLAGADAATAAGLAAPFAGLGVAFQMQDDVVDLYGEKGREARGADLREGKISALVVTHLTLHPDDAGWLLDLLRLPRAATPAAAVADAIARIRAGGALAAVCATIVAELDAGAAVVAPRLAPLYRALAATVAAPLAGLA